MATSKIEKVTNESGSNYCKMPDGTLIQWGEVSMTTGTVAAPLGYHATKVVTFAMAFVSVPTVITSPEEHGGYWNSGGINVTNSGFAATIAGNQQSVTKNVDWIAIGRWK